MHKCYICNKETKSSHALAAHIRTQHKLTKKQYYDTYIKLEGEGKCKVCNNETAFRGTRYLDYCSNKCVNLCPAQRKIRSDFAKGNIQSKETIEKRIKNTDQVKREHSRITTLLSKYGTKSTAAIMSKDALELRNLKLSLFHKGRPHSKEHHIKVIESKRKNNTLKHSELTKLKISDSLKTLYQGDDPPICIGKSNGRGHKCGYIDGIYFRSSYEEIFILTCKKFNIEIISAENKEFRIRYKFNDKQHFYYPDFYLPKYDCVVEIKPVGLLHDDRVSTKLDAWFRTNKTENYLLLTEEELFDNKFEWVNDLEYFLVA